MSDWLETKRKLGRTDLYAGPLGFGASYRAPAKSLEAAFEHGCNYFYWGALRNNGMRDAIRNITTKGKREDLIVVIQDFRRNPKGLEKSLVRGLKKGHLDYADVLLLGWHNHPPKPKLMEAAMHLKERGLFRYLGLSSHNRLLFPELAKDNRVDIFHIRYNAAHRGAEEEIFPDLPEARPGIIVFNATRHASLIKSKKIPDNEKHPTAGDCYRFVLTNPYVDVAISGPSQDRQVEENLKETARGPMAEEEMRWMHRVGDSVYKKGVGPR
ncbi:MAG: aldo/keto reductase [Candidatus Aminicenantes bacterium]|nr:aldo/keto reductase [Candidatus Aminicenantes bacterium]